MSRSVQLRVLFIFEKDFKVCFTTFIPRLSQRRKDLVQLYKDIVKIYIVLAVYQQCLGRKHLLLYLHWFSFVEFQQAHILNCVF